MKNRKIRLGKYKHFKGHLYDIIGVAKYSEDEKQEFVVYNHTPLDKNGRIQLWIRPKKMFLEEVEINGEKVPRFKFISQKK